MGVRALTLLGALVLAVAGLPVACGDDEPAPLRNLLFVSLDTVRRDHLSLYGYPRETTPRLDAFARGAVVFDNAFAQHVNTQPSHASMFTGLYPQAHGAVFNGTPLDPKKVTLAQILAQTGYRTAGFVSAIPMVGKFTGLDRGFEHYDDAMGGPRRDGRETLLHALAWLGRRPADEPFFAFVHLYDAHGPYLPARRYASLFRSGDPGRALDEIPGYQVVEDPGGARVVHLNHFVDRYDAMLRTLDDLMAELLDAVDLDDTVVVVVSDHGETFGERRHVLDHGGQVFDEQIRIPLLLHAPGVPARRVPQLVETVDLVPTLLELLGVGTPASLELHGLSLLPLLEGRAGDPDAVIFSSALALPDRHRDRAYELEPTGQIHALRTGRWKLALYPGTRRDYIELYDLEADPQERTNVADAQPEVRDQQLARLREWMELGDAALPPTELSPELRRHLEDLGYATP